MGAPLGAQTQEDVDTTKAEREEIRTDAADVAGRIDALGDDAADLVVKLDLLEVTINAAESRLDVAAANVAATAADLGAADQEIVDLKAVKDDLRTIVVDAAVAQYIGGHENAQTTVLSAENPVEWSLRQGLYSIVVTDLTTVYDQLRVVDVRLAHARAEALQLADVAATQRAELIEVAAASAAARQEQAQVLSKVQGRMERRLAEADALADLDAALSQEIRSGEEEIARRLVISQALERQRQRETAEQNQAPAAEGEPDDNGSGLDGGGRVARPDDIVNVRGFQIHHSIADNLLAMINAAEADGIILGGSGWRSVERQISLRVQNCGSTDYLIFDAPAEACYPPTARPATSNHEAGLAVDMTAGGFAIVSRDTTAFQWLATNAARYGFYNLWSEPWHWSIDGR
jgi:hypothetical protein